MSGKRENETFRLFQPGLMDIDELKVLFSQRGVKVKSNENETKQKYVETYEQYFLPLSQRKFPNKGIGRTINKKIVVEDRKKGRTEPKSSDFQYYTNEFPSKRQTSHQSSSKNDRLKPPIGSSSPPSKKICLSRRSSADKDLDKIIIKDHSKRHSESSNERSDSESKHLSDTVKKGSSKRPSVKTHSSSSTKDSKEVDKEDPKHKRKRIAWP